MSLELQGIVAGYDGTVVLRDVDLVVPPGTTVALIGSNGVGKTTLLRVASGLLPAQRGTVRLDGHDVTGLGPHALVARGVCHVPEGRGIFPTMTVRENLRVFARRTAHGEGLDEVGDLFPVLGRRAGQAAGTLSGGEQQMLALARAYITEPRYVLLDEVSMGLAPTIVDEIFRILGQLVERGCALLLVEQFVDRALAMADIAYVLRKGRVAFAGQPGELDVAGLTADYLGDPAAR